MIEIKTLYPSELVAKYPYPSKDNIVSVNVVSMDVKNEIMVLDITFTPHGNMKTVRLILPTTRTQDIETMLCLWTFLRIRSYVTTWSISPEQDETITKWSNLSTDQFDRNVRKAWERLYDD